MPRRAAAAVAAIGRWLHGRVRMVVAAAAQLASAQQLAEE